MHSVLVIQNEPSPYVARFLAPSFNELSAVVPAVLDVKNMMEREEDERSEVDLASKVLHLKQSPKNRLYTGATMTRSQIKTGMPYLKIVAFMRLCTASERD